HPILLVEAIHENRLGRATEASKMTQKTTAFIVLVLVLSVGFIMGSFIGGFIISKLSVPASHQSIVDSMTVTDTKANIELAPKLVSSGNVEWAKGLTVLFTKGKEYPHTVWVWQRYGDTEIVMTIWGPDETGKKLFLEFGRTGADPFVVKINGVTKLTIDEATSSPAIGYYCLEVEVE
ncbi:MAG: hypothetical protein ACPLZY_04955, partial [Candidatus Norongarragalinales archaeon]